MRAVITRKMVVANDAGSPVQFHPSTADKPFETISDGEFRRLRRAGAAVPFAGAVDIPTTDETEAQAEGGDGPDLDKMTKAELIAHAEANSITVDPSATKAVILAAIKGA